MAKKKAVKKKAVKKTTARKAPPARPAFTASAAASADMTKRDSKYVNFKEPGTVMARLLPRFDDNPAIFYKSVLHYKMKDPDDLDRAIALGCLDHHDNSYCYVCAVAAWLAGQENPAWAKMGTGFGSMEAVDQVYVQGWVHNLESGKWEGPKIFNIPCGPKGIAPKLTRRLSQAEDQRRPSFVDLDKGETLALIREGMARKTEYDVQSTGEFMTMEQVDEHWNKKRFKDVAAELDIKVWDIAMQREVMELSHPQLPWAQIDAEVPMSLDD